MLMLSVPPADAAAPNSAVPVFRDSLEAFRAVEPDRFPRTA